MKKFFCIFLICLCFLLFVGCPIEEVNEDQIADFKANFSVQSVPIIAENDEQLIGNWIIEHMSANIFGNQARDILEAFVIVQDGKDLYTYKLKNKKVSKIKLSYDKSKSVYYINNYPVIDDKFYIYLSLNDIGNLVVYATLDDSIVKVAEYRKKVFFN